MTLLNAAFFQRLADKASYKSGGSPIFDEVMDAMHGGRISISSGKVIKAGNEHRDHRFSLEQYGLNPDLFKKWWDEAFADYRAQGKFVPKADIHHILNINWLTTRENIDKAGTLMDERNFKADLLNNYDKLERNAKTINKILDGQNLSYDFDDTESVIAAMGQYFDTDISPALKWYGAYAPDAEGGLAHVFLKTRGEPFIVVGDKDLKAAHAMALDGLKAGFNDYRAHAPQASEIFDEAPLKIAVAGNDDMTMWSIPHDPQETQINPNIRFKSYTPGEVMLIRLMQYRDALQDESHTQRFLKGTAYTELNGVAFGEEITELLELFDIERPPLSSQRFANTEDGGSFVVQTHAYLMHVKQVNVQLRRSLNAYFNERDIDHDSELSQECAEICWTETAEAHGFDPGLPGMQMT